MNENPMPVPPKMTPFDETLDNMMAVIVPLKHQVDSMTKEDIDKQIDSLEESVKQLRRFSLGF